MACLQATTDIFAVLLMQIDNQAQARAHRIGQTKQVRRAAVFLLMLLDFSGQWQQKDEYAQPLCNGARNCAFAGSSSTTGHRQEH